MISWSHLPDQFVRFLPNGRYLQANIYGYRQCPKLCSEPVEFASRSSLVALSQHLLSFLLLLRAEPNQPKINWMLLNWYRFVWFVTCYIQIGKHVVCSTNCIFSVETLATSESRLRLSRRKWLSWYLLNCRGHNYNILFHLVEFMVWKIKMNVFSLYLYRWLNIIRPQKCNPIPGSSINMLFTAYSQSNLRR